MLNLRETDGVLRALLLLLAADRLRQTGNPRAADCDNKARRELAGLLMRPEVPNVDAVLDLLRAELVGRDKAAPQWLKPAALRDGGILGDDPFVGRRP